MFHKELLAQSHRNLNSSPRFSGSCPQYSDVGRVEVSLSLCWGYRTSSCQLDISMQLIANAAVPALRCPMFPLRQKKSLCYTMISSIAATDWLKYFSKCANLTPRMLHSHYEVHNAYRIVDVLWKNKSLYPHRPIRVQNLTCIRNTC